LVLQKRLNGIITQKSIINKINGGEAVATKS